MATRARPEPLVRDTAVALEKRRSLDSGKLMVDAKEANLSKSLRVSQDVARCQRN